MENIQIEVSGFRYKILYECLNPKLCITSSVFNSLNNVLVSVNICYSRQTISLTVNLSAHTRDARAPRAPTNSIQSTQIRLNKLALVHRAGLNTWHSLCCIETSCPLRDIFSTNEFGSLETLTTYK